MSEAPFKRPFSVTKIKVTLTDFIDYLVVSAPGESKIVARFREPAEAQWLCDTLNRATPAGDGREEFEKPCPACGWFIRDNSAAAFYCPGCSKPLPDGFYDAWQAARSAPRLTEVDQRVLAVAMRDVGERTDSDHETVADLLAIIDRLTAKDPSNG